MSTKGGQVFTFTLPAGRLAHLLPVSYATACSANLYDIVANLPEGPPILKSLEPRQSKFASAGTSPSRLCPDGLAFIYPVLPRCL